MKNKYYTVSELSAYASDPVKFCQHRGKEYNTQAAKKGTDAHNRVGKQKSTVKIPIPILILIVLVIVFINYYTRTQ